MALATQPAYVDASVSLGCMRLAPIATQVSPFQQPKSLGEKPKSFKQIPKFGECGSLGRIAYEGPNPLQATTLFWRAAAPEMPPT